MARRAGWVICNEANRARFMKSYYRLPEMPTVVRTALPRDWPIPERDQDLRKKLIRQLNCKPTNCRLIAVGGSYLPGRCTDQLLAAMDFLPASYNLVFTGMKGKSPDDPGMKAIREHGLTGRVILLDHLPFQDLLRYYAVCDVGMLLYPNDGIGNYYQAPGRLTEYMATGLPFVAFDFPNFRLLSLQHNLGVVCDPGSPESIADAIRQICERPQHKRQEERERLRKLARTEFAYESQAGRLEEIIRQAQEAIK
jgi:glycosyltransferase involved in cell wall biosynthesis